MTPQELEIRMLKVKAHQSDQERLQLTQLIYEYVQANRAIPPVLETFPKLDNRGSKNGLGSTKASGTVPQAQSSDPASFPGMATLPASEGPSR